MNFLEWSKSNVDYGHKLIHSALEGVHEAEGEFLQDESRALSLSESARHALAPVLVGAFLGALSGGAASPRRSSARTLAFGLLGGAIGLGAGIAWKNRQFTASVASGAWKKINQTRDEHWFEKNPIDYA
ncbi:MAG TPA: hypothetical protein VH350_06630 [Candidatus Sulfotelmatobacter sp.]|jgi:hypothetical protein|nr:hypothetical protein [Candidatus Sulfotelmatobacter sp.]